MATLRENLVTCQRESLKALTLLAAKDALTATVDPSRDVEGETQITLTAGQKLQLLNSFRAALNALKAAAADIVVP